MSLETTIRIAYISGGFPLWALYVANEKGFFKNAGFTCEFTQSATSNAQMIGLQQGQYDIGLQLPDHIVRSTANGHAMRIIAAQSHPPDVGLSVDHGIQNLAQLRNQRIAVDGANTGYSILLKKLLLSAGLTLQDYELIEVGGTKERLDYMKSGQVTACLLNPPFDQELIQLGYTKLTSTAQAFPEYPGPVVAAMDSWINQNRSTALDFQKAWQESWEWLIDPLNTVPALEIAIQHLNATEISAQNTLKNIQTKGVPGMSLKGITQVIDMVLASQDQRPKPEELLFSR